VQHDLGLAGPARGDQQLSQRADVDEAQPAELEVNLAGLSGQRGDRAADVAAAGDVGFARQDQPGAVGHGADSERRR
jgi:hypothetical protein